jgi:hypothetical protein
MAIQLSDEQRKLIHDLALGARELLTREARELLEGTYGLYADGRLDPPDKLPQVQADPETQETYLRLKGFIEDEVQAGLARDEAVEKLVKEVAFTHLNRLVAFKMMEARKLIRGTLDKGAGSNNFKFYLADPEHAADYALYQQGQVDVAYRHFLLWQAGQVAQEIRVLFDPDNLVSRLLPRPRALEALLELLNKEALEDIWSADETIGWVYQYFNEPELQAAFAKIGGGEKFEAEDIPSATQLFTPNWIVRYLVQNTLGRLWVQMHPDTGLIQTEVLDYLVPLEGEVPSEPVRPVKEITLLDPACGGMHFGLVAFDLFHAMYMEELDRAGEPGWPETPSVFDAGEIPAAIISRNLLGIDIDLRAVQLAALALFLKAKSYNKNARITDNNLAVAGVLPFNGARLGAFLREAHFTRPVYERLLRALWERLRDARQLGSLLRLEKELAELVETERKRYEQAPLFAGMPGEFEAGATDEAFWEVVGTQIVRSLHEFAREQAQEGEDETFFVGEAVKGMRLLDLMLREYDLVVTNPPYMNRRKMNGELAKLVQNAYPEGKQDLYAAFIQRCLELAGSGGYVGMLTMHSFMFISSYEALRDDIREQAAISTMAHCGPALFDVGNPGTLQTTAFVLRAEEDAARRENNLGAYFRLVHAPSGEGKRLAFEQALRDGSNTYHVAQHRFDAIPGRPWAYWVSDQIRDLFETLPKLGEIAQPVVGLQTADNFRFLRYWWEVGLERIGRNCADRVAAVASGRRWFPYMKGGAFRRWYGNQEYVVNWHDDGLELDAFRPRSVIRNRDYYFREGLTWGDLNVKGFAVRYSPGGFIFDVKGSSGFPDSDCRLTVMGIMNSSWTQYALRILNPTASFQVGDISRVPLAALDSNRTVDLTVEILNCIRPRCWQGMIEESSWDLLAPIAIRTGFLIDQAEDRLAGSEAAIEAETYRLYALDEGTRAEIAAELGDGPGGDEDGEEAGPAGAEAEEPEVALTQEELSTRWLGFAIGVVLNRFQPGMPGALGSAVYRRSDFAIGSLPEPSEEEFDELVGPVERFAYVDEDAGRHVFSSEVEQGLRVLALPDGIALLDEGHPRDLPALVDEALRLMLGDEAARELIAEGVGGDMRRFLERDFFTRWHFKWYWKRPVYWPLQSAWRSYGFVLFHEKIDDQTFFKLQRDYLDPKLNGLRLHIEDLRGRAGGLSGAALKRVEREIDQTTRLLEEIGDFARTIERIVQEGYQPQPNWIDDGVILRMAPLWELIPIWKSEPKKYWERLSKGDFDWSHIAMNYWPDRVREACRTNKSYAIAHGHVEWYEGE